MATLKQRLHRKNASGTYDTIHFESASDVILRPSGRTVEQDLADYLPEVQDSDNVPQSLSKLIIGNTKGFIRGKALSVEGHTHSEYADKTHSHTMNQLSGILPVENGGTGVQSVSALKNLLGITGSSSGGSTSNISHFNESTMLSYDGQEEYINSIPSNAEFVCIVGLYFIPRGGGNNMTQCVLTQGSSSAITYLTTILTKNNLRYDIRPLCAINNMGPIDISLDTMYGEISFTSSGNLIAYGTDTRGELFISGIYGT